MKNDLLAGGGDQPAGQAELFQRIVPVAWDSLEQILNNVATAIEARDSFSTGHIWRMSEYARLLSSALSWPLERARDFVLGAALHDLGMVGVRESLVNKRGPLSESDFSELDQHPVAGSDLICSYILPVTVVACIEAHHERWDGFGYPNGLRGAAIPIAARLLAVIDAFDAMTSARPYRGPMTADDAIAELLANAGTQFSPEAVDWFVDLWLSHALDHVLLAYGPGQPLLICPTCGPIIAPPEVPDSDHRTPCPACRQVFLIADLISATTFSTESITAHAAEGA